MITKIVLSNVATYSDRIEISPNKINYFFGGNGTGKTSLSRVISNNSNFHDCNIIWETAPLDIYTYNRDFVRTNFDQSREIKGIFTLGANIATAQAEIDLAKSKIDSIKNELKSLNISLDQKNEELLNEEKRIIQKSWEVKLKYESTFKPAFTGFMWSTKAFYDKCQLEINNISNILSEDDLKEKSGRIFSDNLKSYALIAPLDYSELAQKETTHLLSTPIIGKENIEVDSLIKVLNNSDWVKEGILFLNNSKDKCPFCQQSIDENLKQKIESFFDETYNQKIQGIKNFKADYNSYIDNIIKISTEITQQVIEIINHEKLKEKIKLLEEEYKNNNTLLESKIKSPSTIVKLKSLEDTIKEIGEIVDAYITIIKKNNSTVKNIVEEKTTLKSEIWKFVVNYLDKDFSDSLKVKSGILKGHTNISNGIKQRTSEIENLEKTIKDKEAQITSVAYSVTQINRILLLYGYTNFRLAEAEKNGFYKIIREDGSEVKDTLSEGEYNFITFLYFYNLLKGSTNNTGITRDRIAIIDDPISSLDSNALFVVCSLIKSINNGIRNGLNKVKQIFILTHNVYFFKEVTFKTNREQKWSEESFWVISKLNNKSKIIKHDSNPIQTTYELLWREINDPATANRITIFNTLRRILEYYFKILGGIEYEVVINKFEGEELIMCRSLIAWINDGSHFIHDDIVVNIDEESVEKYLKVFQLIFIRMGHEGHYNMMTRSDKKSQLLTKTITQKQITTEA